MYVRPKRLFIFLAWCGAFYVLLWMRGDLERTSRSFFSKGSREETEVAQMDHQGQGQTPEQDQTDAPPDADKPNPNSNQGGFTQNPPQADKPNPTTKQPQDAIGGKKITGEPPKPDITPTTSIKQVNNKRIQESSTHPSLVQKQTQNNTKSAASVNVPATEGTNLTNTTKPKTILFWTVYGASASFNFGLGQEVFKHANCKVADCRTTNDRSALDEADAVVFNNNNINMKDMPTKHRDKQVWAYFNLDSPFNSGQQSRNGRFDLTMTYKNDSHIYMPAGWVDQLSDNEKPKPGQRNFANGKKKLVAWFANNCHTQTMREAYVNELQNHIPVDVYGKCGPLQFSKSMDAYKLLRSDYKFYLSFEKNFCREYVTKRLWRAMVYDVVPIVMGSADYSKLLPAHSFIDVRDFDSPEKLADHLKELDKNDTMYNEYMKWKENYKIVFHSQLRYDLGFCKLCSLLHKPETFKKPRLNDLETWHSVKKDCRTAETFYSRMPLAKKWLYPD